MPGNSILIIKVKCKLIFYIAETVRQILDREEDEKKIELLGDDHVRIHDDVLFYCEISSTEIYCIKFWQQIQVVSCIGC